MLAVALLAAGAGLLWPLRGLHVTAVSMAVVDGQVSVAVTVSEVPRRCTTRIAVLDTSVTAPWSGGTVHALLTPTVADADAEGRRSWSRPAGACARPASDDGRLHPSA